MTETIDETFGEVVQARLQELGWNNAELARRTGFSATHVGNLIRDFSPGSKTGKPRRMTAETVDKFARVLGISMARLRRAAGLAPPEVAPFPEKDQILAYLSELPEDKRADVFAMIQALHARYAKQGQKEPTEPHVVFIDKEESQE